MARIKSHTFGAVPLRAPMSRMARKMARMKTSRKTMEMIALIVFADVAPSRSFAVRLFRNVNIDIEAFVFTDTLKKLWTLGGIAGQVQCRLRREPRGYYGNSMGLMCRECVPAQCR